MSIELNSKAPEDSSPKRVSVRKEIWIILLAALIINLLYLNWKDAPVMYPDSESYIQAARQIINLDFSHITNRTPVYPLFLSPFVLIGRISWIIYGQAAAGIMAALFLYLIVLRILKNSTNSLLITIFLILDYQVACYQSTLLTESLTVTLLLVLVYLHMILPEKGPGFIFFTTFFDLFLIFTKPAFIILPIVLWLTSILRFSFLRRKEPVDKKFLLMLTGAILINLAAIMGWSTLNLIETKSFGFSNISEINMLGKMIQYGYLDRSYENPPPPIAEVLEIKEDLEKDGDLLKSHNPYEIIGRMAGGGSEESLMSRLRESNKAFMRLHRIDYCLKTLSLMPMVMCWTRYYYVKPADYLNNKLFYALDRIFLYLTGRYLIAFLFCAAFCIYLWRRRRLEEGFMLGYILISILYVVTTISAFCYDNDYSRSRVSVDYFLNFLTLFFLMNILIILPGNLYSALRNRIKP